MPSPADMPGAGFGPTFIEPTPVPDAIVDDPTPVATAPAEPKAKKDKSAPPWGSDEEFDPEKAWKLIQNLRGETEQYKEYKNKAAPILEEHERLRRASQTELEQAREDINALSAREQAWRSKAVSAEAKSHAATFIDADAAMALVGDLSNLITEDGIDSDAIAARFEQLAADKPHLVKPDPTPPRFTPNRAQGQSGTGQIPIDAQISAAQERGDLMTAIALKQARRYNQ